MWEPYIGCKNTEFIHDGTRYSGAWENCVYKVSTQLGTVYHCDHDEINQSY